MSLSIRTNVASLDAQRNLGITQEGLARSMSRLSSGFRITRSGDDAAGLGISTKLEAQIRSYNQAIRNANDGLSVVQTAEAGLDESANILTRLRELAMQSASDGIGDTERAYVDTEAQGLLAELQRISQTTQFNGVRLLDGSATRLDFQVGVEGTANDVISLSTLDATTAVGGTTPVTPPSATPTAFAVTPWLATASTFFNGRMNAGDTTNQAQAATAAMLNGARPGDPTNSDLSWTVTYVFDVGYRAAGGVPGNEAYLGAPNAAQAAGLALVATTAGGGTGSGVGSSELATAYQAFAQHLVTSGGDVTTAVNQTFVDLGGTPVADRATLSAVELFRTHYAAAAGGPMPLNVTLTSAGATAGLAAVGQSYSAGGGGVTTTGGLGVAGLSLASQASAVAALDTVDAALDRVSTARSSLGAAGNRFEAAIANIQATSESLSAANSRIRDVDVAAETSALARHQILAQAAVSVLAQANQSPQLALKLLA
jgi:flagellin